MCSKAAKLFRPLHVVSLELHASRLVGALKSRSILAPLLESVVKIAEP